MVINSTNINETVSSTNKSDRHDKTEMLLKVALWYSYYKVNSLSSFRKVAKKQKQKQKQQQENKTNQGLTRSDI